MSATPTRLAQCSSLKELASIAIDCLQELTCKGPISQLCGPMSTGGFGLRELNLKVFHHAIEVGLEKGVNLFNQLPFQDAMIRLTTAPGPNSYKLDVLENFYLPVFESGYVKQVYFLPLWDTSKGAVWERTTLLAMGSIAIHEYPLEWYKEVLNKMRNKEAELSRIP